MEVHTAELLELLIMTVGTTAIFMAKLQRCSEKGSRKLGSLADINTLLKSLAVSSAILRLKL